MHRARHHGAHQAVPDGNPHPTPAQVVILSDVTAISAGVAHSLALKSDGTVYAWGWNSHGQLGDNSKTDRSSPVQVVGPGGSGFLTNIIALADGKGKYHSMALRSDHTVWVWGWNYYGQLGNNSTVGSLFPIQVNDPGGNGFLTGVADISVGRFFSVALRDNGTVLTWGWGRKGELGSGAVENRYIPASVRTLSGGSLTIVTALWPVSNARLGKTVRLWALVENEGTEDLPANANVWFWVDGPGWSGNHWSVQTPSRTWRRTMLTSIPATGPSRLPRQLAVTHTRCRSGREAAKLFQP